MVNENQKALRRSGGKPVAEVARNEPGVQAFLESRGTTHPRTLETYLEHLGMARRRSLKPFLELSVAEARRLAGDLKATGSSRTLCGAMRMFYAYHERPDLVKLFKVRAKPLTIDKDDLVTDDEVNALLANAEAHRDAALIGALFECGVRVAEICAVRLRDVDLIPSPENGGKKLVRIWFRKSKIEGEQHSFILVDSADLVIRWYETYPLPRQGGEAPLFPSASRHNYGGVLTRPGVDGILKGAARRAGFGTAKFHPHAARHYAATRLIRSGMSDSMVKKSLGWRPASGMLGRYSHVIGQDAENAYMKSRGLNVSAAPGPKPFGAPKPDIPDMPAPPPDYDSVSQEVAELRGQLETLQKAFAVTVSSVAAHAGIPQGAKADVQIAEGDGSVLITAKKPEGGTRQVVLRPPGSTSIEKAIPPVPAKLRKGKPKT